MFVFRSFKKLQKHKEEKPLFYQILNDLKYWQTYYKDDLKFAGSESLKSELSTLKEKFDNCFIEFEKNWRNWNTDDICQWNKILHDQEYFNFCIHIELF